MSHSFESMLRWLLIAFLGTIMWCVVNLVITDTATHRYLLMISITLALLGVLGVLALAVKYSESEEE